MSPRPSALPVIEVPPGTNAFDVVADRSQPAVLRGLARDWPIVKRAASMRDAMDYLRSFDAGAPVTAFVGAPEIGGRLHYTESLSDTNFEQRQVQLDWVLEQIEAAAGQSAPQTLYMGSSAIRQCLPGLEEKNSLDPGARQATVRIWIGNRTTVAAHFDVLKNIACVAVGRRRFTLFPPEQLCNLYVGPMELTPAGQQVSLVDFRDPDLERFPKAREALEHAQSAELEPGDAIFVPSLWWHHVEALTPFNVLVNHWWRDMPAYTGPPGDALLHAILNIRQLAPAERAGWRAFFDHYVFDPPDDVVAHIPRERQGALGPLDDELARRIRHLLRMKLNR